MAGFKRSRLSEALSLGAAGFLEDEMMIVVLLLLTLFQQPEPVIFDTVVTRVTPTRIRLEWECADAPGKLCGEIVPIELLGTGSFRYWPKKVERGQLLKAVLIDGRLTSIAGCNERFAAAVKEYSQGLELRPPTNSLMPEDCVRRSSAFTLDLLDKNAPKKLKRPGGQ